MVPLLADLRQSAVEFASTLVAYAAGLEAQVDAADQTCLATSADLICCPQMFRLLSAPA